MNNVTMPFELRNCGEFTCNGELRYWKQKEKGRNFNKIDLYYCEICGTIHEWGNDLITPTNEKVPEALLKTHEKTK